METFITTIICISLLLALVIALVVVLKDGKFSFSLGIKDKKDALHINAEHQHKDLDR